MEKRSLISSLLKHKILSKTNISFKTHLYNNLETAINQPYYSIKNIDKLINYFEKNNLEQFSFLKFVKNEMNFNISFFNGNSFVLIHNNELFPKTNRYTFFEVFELNTNNDWIHYNCSVKTSYEFHQSKQVFNATKELEHWDVFNHFKFEKVSLLDETSFLHNLIHSKTLMHRSRETVKVLPDYNYILTHDFNDFSSQALLAHHQHFIKKILKTEVLNNEIQNFCKYFDSGNSKNSKNAFSIVSKIGPEKLSQMYQRKEFINQKQDLKKYLDFNCNLNFNKLNYFQINLIYTLNKHARLFNFTPKIWKQIVNMIVVFNDLQDHNRCLIGLFYSLSQEPLLEPTNNSEWYELRSWAFELLQYIFLYYIIREKLLTFNLTTSLLTDIFRLQYHINQTFDFNLSFNLLHQLRILKTEKEKEKYLINIHDYLINKISELKLEDVKNKSVNLKVIKKLLNKTKDINFVPIKNTYELFLLGEEFHNCVYTRKDEKNAVFYKVEFQKEKYCLQINQKNKKWTLTEIKKPCNKIVKEQKVIHEIEKQLKKYNSTENDAI